MPPKYRSSDGLEAGFRTAKHASPSTNPSVCLPKSYLDTLRRASPAKLLLATRDLYKQKRWDDTLIVLQIALDSGDHADTNAVKLLDYRAGCLKNLGRLDEALKVARRMIELDEQPSSARIKGFEGYLRAGNILELMQKPQAALKIYARGCKAVGSESAAHVALEAAQNRLEASLVPAQFRDPFQVLPAELMEIILLELPFTQRLTCLRVSKHWKAVLSSFPSLWAVLDLTGKPSIISVKAVERQIRLAKNQVKKVMMTPSSPYQFETYLRLLRSCKRLESLCIDEFMGIPETLECLNLTAIFPLKELRLECPGYMDWESLDLVVPLLKPYQNLEHLSLKNVAPFTVGKGWDTLCFYRLKTLKLTIVPGKNPIFQDVRDLPNAPNLETLCLSFNSVPPDRIELSARYPRLTLLHVESFLEPKPIDLDYPPTLRYIYLLKTGLRSIDCHEVLRKVPRGLEQLCVDDTPPKEFPKRFRVPRRTPDQMRALTLTLDFFKLNEIFALLRHPRLADLESIDLDRARPVTDEVVEVMCETMKSLAYIALHQSQITGVALRTMGIRLENLRHVRLIDCDRVGTDAVTWLRDRIADVKIQTSR